MKCFGVRVGDMCLYRPRGMSAGSGPYLFRRPPGRHLRAWTAALPTPRRMSSGHACSRAHGTAGQTAARRPRPATAGTRARTCAADIRQSRAASEPETRGDGEHTSEVAHTELRTRRRARRPSPVRANRSPLLHLHDPHVLPAPLTAFPVSYCLLILIFDHLPLAAAPPPALPPICLGCPARFLWQVEEGGSSASAVDPSSEAQA